MTQFDALRDMDAEIHSAFSDAGFAFADGVYTPLGVGAVPVDAVRGYLNRGVQVLGDFEQVVDRRDEVELLRSNVSFVKGATIDIEGDRYVLDARVDEDESKSVWAVRRTGAVP